MSEASDMIDSYRRRRLNLMTSADEIAADIKELDLEAKANGLNVAEVKKWVVAEHKDKLGKRVSDVVDSVLIGEALGYNLGSILNSESDVGCEDLSVSNNPTSSTRSVVTIASDIAAMAASNPAGAAAVVAAVEAMADTAAPITDEEACAYDDGAEAFEAAIGIHENRYGSAGPIACRQAWVSGWLDAQKSAMAAKRTGPDGMPKRQAAE